MNRVLMSTVLSLCLALGLFSAPTFAADLATVSMGSGGIAWQPTASAASWVLTVSGPENFYLRQEFDSAPSMDLFTGDGQLLADGLYKYELTAIPHLSSQLRQELDAAAGDLEQRERLAARLQSLGGVQSGSFRIQQGSLVASDRAELGPETMSNAASAEVPTMELDQVFLDDVIVDGSLCVGFDCVNGESFGFDTLRLKENNLRIHFDDTSSAGSFPSNDWRLIANDSANGGANRFSIDDATAGRSVFTIEAGARSNALYVDDGGRVGIGTNSPVVEAHVVDGDSPTLRLEQNGSSGFTPQTWDVAGNETNFFVRDVTNGSTLPFRIRPGAPTSSIDIEGSTGDVGFGTTSPTAPIHVLRSNGTAQVLVQETSTTEAVRVQLQLTNNGRAQVRLTDTSADGGNPWFFGTREGSFQINEEGDAGQNDFILSSNGDLTISGDLTTGGTGACSSGCDRVFDPDYKLPTIEEHAAAMWGNGHLPAVGPTPETGPFNLSRMTGGMLNELEKAHIYIAELHDRLEAKNEAFESIKVRLEQIEAQLNARP